MRRPKVGEVWTKLPKYIKGNQFSKVIAEILDITAMSIKIKKCVYHKDGSTPKYLNEYLTPAQFMREYELLPSSSQYKQEYVYDSSTTTPQKPDKLPCNEFVPDRQRLRDYFMSKKRLGG